MPKIISNVDLLNAMRKVQGSTFKDRIPEATQDNLGKILSTMDKFPEMYHELTGELLQKIGLQIMADFDEFVNPLEIFKKGAMPFGKVIEEIWMDLYPAQEYDQTLSETEVLKRVKANIKTSYHVENREEFYKSTISIKELRQVFYSENGIYDYVYGLFTKRLFQSNELDEYLIMKEVLDMGVAEATKTESKIATYELEYTDDAQFSRALAKVLRSVPKALSFYNTSTISGLQNVTSVKNQVIVTTPEIEAMLDVDVLSTAFHMEKAQSDGRLAVINQFKDEDVLAVIVSKDWLKHYDTYKNLEPDVYNPQGLYRNMYFHAHAVISFSKMEHIVVIKKKKTVTP